MAAAMLSMIATYIRHIIPSSKGKRATAVILTTFRFMSFGTTTRLLFRLLSAQLRVDSGVLHGRGVVVLLSKSYPWRMYTLYIRIRARKIGGNQNLSRNLWKKLAN